MSGVTKAEAKFRASVEKLTDDELKLLAKILREEADRRGITKRRPRRVILAAT